VWLRRRHAYVRQLAAAVKGQFAGRRELQSWSIG
jgi:hypothetical protein